MDTIKIDSKIFIIDKVNCNNCDKCIFNVNNNKDKYPYYYCLKTYCIDFIVIREVNVIDKIRMWLKKKINK